MNQNAGWGEVWENVGKPFFTTCIVVYFLVFVVFEIVCLFL